MQKITYLIANTETVSNTVSLELAPIYNSIASISIVLCILFIVFGGYYYITSTGRPLRIEKAKTILRNSLLGAIIVMSASSLLAVIQNAHVQKPTQPVQALETQTRQPDVVVCPLCDVINQSIASFIQVIVNSISKPVIAILNKFTVSTPLMAQNPPVFSLWLIIVAIADSLFLVVISLIGLRVMSASVIGISDLDIDSLFPQVIAVFIVANLSIFIIDALIIISNVMISAFLLGTTNTVLWDTLLQLINKSNDVNIGVLIFILVAIILAVLLLISYIKRLAVLYAGAILSPLVILIWLLPSFRDFTTSAVKAYIVTIFVLFVQITILTFAAFLFANLSQNINDILFTIILIIATISLLLSVNSTLSQYAILNTGSYGFRKINDTFIRGISHLSSSAKLSFPNRSAISANTFFNRPSTSAISSYPKHGHTTQELKHVAAEELTRKGSNSEVVVTRGLQKPEVTVTRIPRDKKGKDR